MTAKAYDYDAILDRWQSGLTRAQIAAELGMPGSIAVRAVIRIMAKRGDPRAVSRATGRTPAEKIPDDGRKGWTVVRFDAAERLYKDGHSASEIAAAIGGGISRNAIIGVANRRGWGGRPKAGDSRRTRQRHAKAEGKPTVIRTKRLSVKPTRTGLRTFLETITSAPIRVVPAPIDEPQSLDVTLLALKAGQCRWPHGEKPFLFCGHPVKGESSYCPHHHARAYQPASAQRRAQRNNFRIGSRVLEDA